MSVDVVIPTVGRPSLHRLLSGLEHQRTRRHDRVIVVDDRADAVSIAAPLRLAPDVQVLRSRGRGPAAARNVGWRASAAAWIAFLDDDVVVSDEWSAALAADLTEQPAAVAAVQGRVRVPLPSRRRPTDWERNVAGLESARWATADMAFRRAALEAVGGFDERFPRAYREDSDLALRLLDAGCELAVGNRTVVHPVGDASWSVSITKQAGNADDALMAAIHGRTWRRRAGAPRGAFRRHLVASALATAALMLLPTRHRRTAIAAGGAWIASTTAFAWRRIAPGPRDAREIAAMIATSAAIPPGAVAHRVAGEAAACRARHASADRLRGPRPAAVLFDRDGTLVVDAPYNGDPTRVVPVPEARRSLERVRELGMRVGLVTNQSGVARGMLDRAAVDAVHDRLQALVGDFDAIAVCPHGPEMILQAAAAMGVDPSACVVIGDIGADVDAAVAAGARAVLVPTPATDPAEVRRVRARRDGRAITADDLASAVDLVAELRA
jgi:HAD superfamily hydrolase (TIGR01662 family)